MAHAAAVSGPESQRWSPEMRSFSYTCSQGLALGVCSQRRLCPLMGSHTSVGSDAIGRTGVARSAKTSGLGKWWKETEGSKANLGCPVKNRISNNGNGDSLEDL